MKMVSRTHTHGANAWRVLSMVSLLLFVFSLRWLQFRLVLPCLPLLVRVCPCPCPCGGGGVLHSPGHLYCFIIYMFIYFHIDSFSVVRCLPGLSHSLFSRAWVCVGVGAGTA